MGEGENSPPKKKNETPGFHLEGILVFEMPLIFFSFCFHCPWVSTEKKKQTNKQINK
jgi:hypothetical protein